MKTFWAVFFAILAASAVIGGVIAKIQSDTADKAAREKLISTIETSTRNINSITLRLKEQTQEPDAQSMEVYEALLGGLKDNLKLNFLPTYLRSEIEQQVKDLDEQLKRWRPKP